MAVIDCSILKGEVFFKKVIDNLFHKKRYKKRHKRDTKTNSELQRKNYMRPKNNIKIMNPGANHRPLHLCID